jgi:hypothetical protein
MSAFSAVFISRSTALRRGFAIRGEGLALGTLPNVDIRDLPHPNRALVYAERQPAIWRPFRQNGHLRLTRCGLKNFNPMVSKRPLAGAHHRQLSGFPVQPQAEAVRGIRQCALSCHPTKDRAAIQFSIDCEKAVIQILGMNS